MAAASSVPRLAKLSPPRLYDALPRERLFTLLDQASKHPVVWIAAPPGAGKTTLAASWLESRGKSGIWCQVDSGDADPASFFYYLGIAERARTGRPRKLNPLPLLTPEHLADVPGFARRFFRELFARLGESAVLVLDNFQEAGGDILHQVVRIAIENVPLGATIVIVSRALPDEEFGLPLANRLLRLIEWEPLKLTREESATIARAHAALNDALLDELYERSGGWAAGLILLAERLRRGASIDDLSAPDSLQEIFGYFAGQLFDRTDAETRQMLMQLSYLPTIPASTAQLLTGDTSVLKLLDHLYRRHLFTNRRSGKEPVYQFHALFRAFLQHRAETDLSQSQNSDTLRNAALLLSKSDQPEEAMPLYVKAADFLSAERLILDKANSLIGQGRWKVVVDWIESLPADRINRNPWLLHWLGTAQIGVTPAKARAVLERAYLAAQADDVMCQVQVAAGMVEATFLEYTIFTPLDQWIPVLEQMLHPDFAFPSLESELRAVSALLIASTYRMPDHPQIERCVSRVRELLRTGVDINLRVSAATHLTLYGSFTGHLEESRRAAIVLAPMLADPAVHVFRRVFAWAVITWYATNASDYVLGDQAVYANEAIARDEGLHIAERFACIIGYFLDMDRRDAKSGLARINRFEQIMIPSQPYEAASLVNMKSWHGVHTNDHVLTLKHGPKAFELYNEAGSIPHTLNGLNALIWACVTGGDEHAARTWIAEHKRMSTRRNMEWARWAPDAAEAILAMRHSDEPILKERLHLIFCEERHRLDQYGHHLALCRDWASTLCGEAISRGVHTERVCRFIAEFKLDAPSPQFEAWPWTLKILTLGRFSVIREGIPISFGSKTPKKLLALLKTIIALGSRDVPEQKLADALWSEEDGDTAHQSLTTALHRLRKLLGDKTLIRQREGRIFLDTDRIWVDALAFDGVNSSATHADALRAIELYRGEFLVHDEDPWAFPMREKLRARYLELVSFTARRFEQDGRHEEALDLYRRGIEADELAETFHQGLMRCHHQVGRTPEALDAYRRMRELLVRVHGMQPSPATEELYRSLSRR